MLQIISRDLERSGPVFPSKVNNKCPPIIFAANRTDGLHYNHYNHLLY